jgi:hypothetical protein
VDNQTFSGPVPIPVEFVDEVGADDQGDLLTPERARSARTKAGQGFWFRLPRTGGKALVRRITSADRVAIGTLPQHQQQRVLNALAKVGDQPSAMRSDGSVALAQWQRNSKANEEICNAYCVAGFVKPRLIFSEMERTDDGQVLVTDLDAYDRQQFFLWSETNNEAAAALFRAVADEPAPDVEVGGPGGVVGEAAIGVSGTKRGRVAS